MAEEGKSDAGLPATLFKAAAAVWGFYGAAQLALLGYVVFPKDPKAELVSGIVLPLCTCLGLFFILNLIAIAALQLGAVSLLPKDARKPIFWIASGAMLAFHLALSASSIWLVATVYGQS